MKTYEDILNEMDGKTFFSSSFFGEMVTLSQQVIVRSIESGRMEIINNGKDASDLYKDYKKHLAAL